MAFSAFMKMGRPSGVLSGMIFFFMTIRGRNQGAQRGAAAQLAIQMHFEVRDD